MKKKLFLAGIISFALIACSKEDVENENNNEGGTETETTAVFNMMWNDSDATSSTTGTYLMTFSSDYLSDNSNSITFNGAGYEIESTRTAYAYSVGEYLYNFSYGGGNLTKYSMPDTDGSDDYNQEGNAVAIGTAVGNTYCRVSLTDDSTAAGHNVTTVNESDDEGNYTTTSATLSYGFVDLSSMAVSSYGTGEIPTTESYEEDGTQGTDVYVWRTHFPYKKTIGTSEYMFYGIARRRLVASSASSDGDYDATAGVMVVKGGNFANIEIMEAPEFNGDRTIGQTYGYRTNPFCEYNDDIYHVTMSNLRILKISGTTGEYDSSYDFDLQDALGASVSTGDSGLGGTGMFYAGDGIAYVPYNDNNLETEDTYKWGLARVDLNTKTAIALNVPSNINLWSYQDVAFNDGKMYMAICPNGSTEGNIYIFDIASTSAEPTIGAKLVNGGSGFYSSLF
ncbi:MAG: hypothetical protein R3Y26_06775 [Rikenellaceae bacterium]